MTSRLLVWASGKKAVTHRKGEDYQVEQLGGCGRIQRATLDMKNCDKEEHRKESGVPDARWTECFHEEVVIVVSNAADRWGELKQGWSAKRKVMADLDKSSYAGAGESLNGSSRERMKVKELEMVKQGCLALLRGITAEQRRERGQ